LRRYVTAPAPRRPEPARLSDAGVASGITEMEAANRFIRDVYLPVHNARFAKPPAIAESAFVPVHDPDALADILCVEETRTVARDNTVSYGRLTLQLPSSPQRPHYVRAQVKVHEYPDGAMAVFLGHADRPLRPCRQPYRLPDPLNFGLVLAAVEARPGSAGVGGEFNPTASLDCGSTRGPSSSAARDEETGSQAEQRITQGDGKPLMTHRYRRVFRSPADPDAEKRTTDVLPNRTS
jgi:hypothetical protein